ncbi:MAG TPA: hypothetical protein VGC66_08855 [Pyrinomonadaceae bacterium]|jgi:hypothetical protein
MALIKKKTRKAISKQVTKLVRKHGPEIAAGLVTSLVTGITAATITNGEGKKSKKKKKKKPADEEEKPKKKTAKA